MLRGRLEGAHRPPWEKLPDGRWFPHVEIRIEPSITTIVGANEAGKTQVIDSIRLGLQGEEIRQTDFCRYSELFGVDAPVSFPEFGLELCDLTHAEIDCANELLELSGAEALTSGASIWLFRTPSVERPTAGTIYWRGGQETQTFEHAEFDDLEDWSDLLPKAWIIDATIALPDSVPIQWLIDRDPQSATSRQERLTLVNTVLANPGWFVNEASVQQHSANIAAQLHRPQGVSPARLAQFAVARRLLVEVAGIDVSTFEALRDAIADTNEGHATAITTAMNDLIRRNLNPARWWSQDPDFSLTIGLRDHDLVFTIRDRTGKDYTFGERSTGLKYFLSYLVQFLAGRPRRGGRPTVLLMDEPDTYLSSRGQQDLLRVLSSAAFPDDPAFAPTQVVYVTHSPFLIDRNHAERVRVLDKGDLDEGTRVVDKAHHNRYEPLRTALGPMVGETTFIGSRNIIVEGPSDQILIAALAVDLRQNGLDGGALPPSEILDLNDVTIVPAGGTPHVPYMAYLARGRGEERPPVVVLLDSDKPGRDARAALSRLLVDKSPVVADEFVIEISEVDSSPRGATAIEDLVTPAVAARAVDIYCSQLGLPMPGLQTALIDSRDRGMLDQLNSMLLAHSEHPLELQKVAFARCVVEALNTAPDNEREAMRRSFQPLVARLAVASAEAFERERTGAIRKRMVRSIRLFGQDHNELSAREHASRLLASLDRLIDEGPNYEPARARVSELRTRYKLHANLGDAFADHLSFVNELQALPDVLRESTSGRTALG
jgi:predicted ATPase